jgi:hypothetical protein
MRPVEEMAAGAVPIGGHGQTVDPSDASPTPALSYLRQLARAHGPKVIILISVGTSPVRPE